MKVRTFTSREYFSCNTYICSINNINFMVDPGCYNKKMKEYIDSIGGISFILCTHGHYDHIGSINDIINDFPSINVYSLDSEFDVIYNPNKNLSSYCEDRGNAFNKYIPNINILPLYVGKNCINKIEFEVYHTPGHTLGSAIFFFNKEKVIFFGDTIICESIGRTDLPTASEEDMYNSLSKIAKLNIPNDTLCYFGHGYMMTYQNLIEKNIYLRKYL